MKKIWIVAPFSDIEIVAFQNRFQYLANRLHNKGIEVTLLTSNFNHRKKNYIPNETSKKYDYKVKLINESGYIKNVSIKRVFSHIKFSNNLKKAIKQMERPDIVYSAYPTMSASYIAGKYAKENNIPFIIDVQDTWPESISSAINTEKLVVKLLMWPFTKFANKIYKMADIVFGVSDTYVERAKIKRTKCKEFITVYIGAELERFDNAICTENKVEKKEEDIWITYIGTLSHSYDIDTAIRALAELKEFSNIKLNILGSGPDEERLIRLSKELGIYDVSVYFYGFIKYKKMIGILKISDIALNAIKENAKQTITNKLGDYISAGLPILNSCQEKEVAKLVCKSELGINYIPGDINMLKKAILRMADNREEMIKFSKNSRVLAEKYFDRNESYKVIVDKIESLLR